MLEPIITEKSTKLVNEGKYTFRVDIGLNKHKIKKLIEKVFGVHVTKVRTLKVAGTKMKTPQGKIKNIKPYKKVIVTLEEKEEIDLFDVKKK